MSILDAAVLLGKETTYGQAATPVRAIEAKADSWQRQRNVLSSIGMRGGMQAAIATRRRQIDMGGGGTVDFDVLTRGMGYYLGAMLGDVDEPVQVGTTQGYEAVARTTAGTPDWSYTVQVLRPLVDGTVVPFTYLGSVITGWTLSCAVDGLLKANLTFDSQSATESIAAATPVYDDSTPFDWILSDVAIDGTSMDAKSFNLSAEMGLKTDRRYMNGTGLKERPQRGAVPTFSGQIDADFETIDNYERWLADGLHEVTATFLGDIISDTQRAQLKVTLAACSFEGETPQVSLSDMTSDNQKFSILHNQVDPAIEISYISADQTL